MSQSPMRTDDVTSSPGCRSLTSKAHVSGWPARAPVQPSSQRQAPALQVPWSPQSRRQGGSAAVPTRSVTAPANFSVARDGSLTTPTKYVPLPAAPAT